jgi:protein deglycase
MAKALVLLAEGFEEIEAVTVVDVMRRARVDVVTAALQTKRVTGAHGIVVEADDLLERHLQLSNAQGAAGSRRENPVDVIVLPGGMPGASNLRDDARVRELIAWQVSAKRLVGAICAGPIALEAAGVLGGRAATSYPGYPLPSARYSEERVVVDGNVVTSRGPGTAFEFALKLVEMLVSLDVARQLRQGMLLASDVR